MTKSIKSERPTMDELKAKMVAMGEKVCLRSWENAVSVQVYSVRCIPGTYGAPAVAITWGHGYLSITSDK